MGWLFRLLYVVVRLLLTLAVRLTLDLVGCGVRLLYWSVRTYGWGRVGSFLAALGGSVWLHYELGRLALHGASVGSVAAGTLGLWGGMMGASLWLGHVWHQRMEIRRVTGPLDTAAIPKTIEAPALTSAGSDGVARPPVNLSQSTPLWEKVVQPSTVQEAWQRVQGRGGGPGPDGVTIEAFSLDAERRLHQLGLELRSGAYRPHPPRWVEMPKPHGGMRRLAVLSVRDRVIQQALNLTLASLWNGRFAPCSFAYRPGRSAIQAVAAVERGLTNGRHWVLDGDIASFFDSVPHSTLFSLLDEWLPDPQVRRLLEGCVAATSPEGGRGLAQGAPLSPLLANLYLHRMDTTLLQAGHTLIRYADDFIVLCATRQQAEAALQTTERLLRHLALSLNPDKTRIVHRDEGFTFLGFTFTRDGKRPSEEGVESLRARLAAAADETTRRQILAGWHGYFATTEGTERKREGTEGQPQRARREQEEEGTEGQDQAAERNDHFVSSGFVSVDSVVAAMYRERFVGRPEVFARYWRKDAQKGYAPVRRPVTNEELSAHIAGTETLGTYLLHPDGTTQAVVLDVDGPQPTEEGQSAALQVARRLVSALQRHGVTPLWVDSGGKGYHLWLCFAEPTQAKAVRQWTARWLEQFRPYPEGVMVEVFPKQDHLSSDALGAVIRLPLGRHPETGRPSGLLTPEGQPVSDPWVALGQAPRVNAQAMLQIGPREGSAVPEPPEAIGPVVRGCALLWGLVRKAAETHHLRHTERLALLYTLGHCGEAGRAYLHQVIALCSNYDPRITERQIQRLEDGHKPIRCGTLKEWLRDHLPGVTCPCVPKGANPSPLDLLRRAKSATPAGPSPTESRPGWSEVAQDLFGEVLPANEKALE